jgi:hypothetical protein
MNTELLSSKVNHQKLKTLFEHTKNEDVINVGELTGEVDRHQILITAQRLLVPEAEDRLDSILLGDFVSSQIQHMTNPEMQSFAAIAYAFAVCTRTIHYLEQLDHHWNTHNGAEPLLLEKLKKSDAAAVSIMRTALEIIELEKSKIIDTSITKNISERALNIKSDLN